MTTPALTAEERAQRALQQCGLGPVFAHQLLAIASAIREAEDAAYERAWREITMTALANAEGASADFTNGLVVAADAVRSLAPPTKEI